MRPTWGGVTPTPAGWRQRVGGGLLCATVAAAGLLPLAMSRSAAASGSPSTGQLLSLPTPAPLIGGNGTAAPPTAAPSATPAPSSLCPTPALSDTVDAKGNTTSYAVQALSQPGEPAAQGPHAGVTGTWVQLNGTGLGAAGCTVTVYVGGHKQQSPPLPDTSNPVPPANSPTQLTFASDGSSGPVQVVLSDPTGGSNASNSNYTYLSQPQLTSVSDSQPAEGSLITASGAGFALGQLEAVVSVSYYDGAVTPKATPCVTDAGSQTEAASTSATSTSPPTLDDQTIDMQAPTTYCSGGFTVQLATQYNTQQPFSTTNQNAVTVAQPGTAPIVVQVRGIVYDWIPRQAQAGHQLTVYGSGFGPAGRLLLSGNAEPQTSWTDHAVTVNLPSNATSGRIELVRRDGSTISLGQVQVYPVSWVPPATSTLIFPIGFLRYEGDPRQLQLGPGTGSVPGSVTPPTKGGTASLPLTPIVPPPSYGTTPVGLTVFGWLTAAFLIAAFVFGFLNVGRMFVYARRARRASAAVRDLVAEKVGGTRRNELRLGRHVRNVEVVGRSTPLGHLLLRQGLIDRRELSDSLQQQRVENRPLGEVVVARGAAGEEDVWRTLGEQWGITLGDLDHHWVDPKIANRLTAVDSIKYRMLAIRAIGDSAIVAMADPFDSRARMHAERCLGHRIVPILASPSAIRRRQEEVYSELLLEESVAALHNAQPEASAKQLTTKAQRRTAIGVGVAAVILAIIFGGRFFIGVAGCIVGLYAVVVTFRTYVIVRGSKFQDVFTVSQEELDALTDLPIYTILCPLYHEPGVLPQLVEACAALDYPPSLLDVKLLLEADDTETLAVVETYPLPPYFDVVVVPAEGPRTKPKACNYGLQFARGEYVVIFDAEDIPEPDQLKKAIATFRRSGPTVGCVQAKLNFYNPRQNLLTGWFALEYTSWFDFFLPGLVDLGLPVPLGGSSNHFPTSLLRDLDAWDPNNVTEDADLGMRLHRAGYHTVIVESTTYEEANSDFVNWIKQRSRWGKGYAVSWLVQMRHPVDLFKAVGWKSFLSIQLTLGGTFGVAVLNLFVWFLTLLWIMAQFNFIAYLFPSAIYYVGMLELLLGNFFFLYMGVWSCQYRRSWELARVAVAAPVYWLMMSLAMLKAALQLITKPTYWEKTAHGLFDGSTALLTEETGEPDAESETSEAEPAAEAEPVAAGSAADV